MIKWATKKTTIFKRCIIEMGHVPWPDDKCCIVATFWSFARSFLWFRHGK
jgi:hypothetical protein